MRYIPSSNIDTMLEDTTFRLATCQRLGARCVSLHLCHCGEAVDSLGHHRLSCSRSATTLMLITLSIELLSNGLVRDDKKRPDAISFLPWKLSRPLVWDAPSADSFSPSHLPSTTKCTGATAAPADILKRRKYSNFIGNIILYTVFPFCLSGMLDRGRINWMPMDWMGT